MVHRALKRRGGGRPAGRPANPRAARPNVEIDPDLKCRTIICNANDGVTFSHVLNTALREYFSRRG